VLRTSAAAQSRDLLRQRLVLPEPPATTYAIGDVHGCLTLLLKLEAMIVKDARKRPGSKLIVLLGDYVDRGAHSAQVIDHLLAAPPVGFQRICLAGNHDDLTWRCLTDFRGLKAWRALGGEETLRSYGMDEATVSRFFSGTDNDRRTIVRSFVPRSHLAFLETLPVALSFPRHVFVHGGLKEGVALEDHDDQEIQTRRLLPSAADNRERGFAVVHGHTPVEHPLISAARLAIDLNPVATGRLCAMRLAPGEAPTPLIANVAVKQAAFVDRDDPSTPRYSGEAQHG